MSLRHYHYISTSADWQTCLKRLQQEDRLAIDLEANSMHAYREQVCLIQISTPDQDFIVDPLINADWEPLGAIIQDSNVEKVFHAVEYDLILLKRQFGWRMNNLFDTMWAARILGYEKYGLANMLHQVFGIELDKRYQKSDWCKRPLSKPQLKYAQLDTHYLLRLRDHLAAELKAANRWQEAQNIFAEQTTVNLPDIDFDPDDFWSITGANDLNKKNQAILKALYVFRDQQAKKRDQPLFKVFSDRTLLELAQKTPQNSSELQDIHGMSNGQVRRYGRSLLKIIAQARHHKPPPSRKRTKRPSERVLERYEKLHTWRKNRAQKRGVESDVIISREALWSIARKNPQTATSLANIPFVDRWRAALYGEEILALLHSKDGNQERA